MSERPDNSRGGAEGQLSDVQSIASAVDAWFAREVLPLEAILMEYLHHNWRNTSDIKDLRQDVYIRVCEAARQKFPDRPKQFLFAIARNLLIDRVRRGNVVPIEAAADLDALEVAADAPGPERTIIARDELRQLQAALDRLPPRCREVVMLRRVEGLSRSEIAHRMGVTEGTVSQHLEHGIRALVDILYGEPPTVRRKP
ncbi:MAG TPA: sigma-70 family RNA polymerase sigma factor [Rhizomicrobium sp.]